VIFTRLDSLQVGSNIMCRRCSNCVGMSHHWIADPMAPDDEEFQSGDYACKHCEQRGDGCDECNGDGYLEGHESKPCTVCNQEGVVPLSSAPIDVTARRIFDLFEHWDGEAQQAAQAAQNPVAYVETMLARIKCELVTLFDKPVVVSRM
jgi:hypothetical protein